MKNMKKILIVACIAFAFTIAAFCLSLEATSVSAFGNTALKVTSSESFSTKAALVLQEKYEGGVHSEHNQWIQYGYDLTTLGEYDYIQISFESSLTVVLFENMSITYQYDTANRYLEVGFQAATNALDFTNSCIENTNDGKVTVSMAVYISNEVVQFNECHVSIHITPYGSFTTPCDMKSAKWTYNEWLFEEEIINFAEYRSRDDGLFLATMQGTGIPFSPMSSGIIADVVATDVTVNYTVTFNGATSVTVSGTVQWTDTDGVSHPARQVLVEVYLPGSLSNFFADSLLIKLETNNQGVFSASNLPNYGLEVRLKISASTKDGFGVEPFGLFDGIYSFKTNFVSTSNNYFASEIGTDTADAFYVHQAIIVGHAYASAMGYSNTPTITFPRSDTQYNPSTDTLWIITEDYCDFDVILHEYGHYIMDKLNIEDQPSGEHYSEDILTDKLQHKEKGIKFAWGEGWATYFGISAQLHQNIAALNIPNAGDTFCHNTINVYSNYDVKGIARAESMGEGQSVAVSRVLLNLTYTGTSTSPIISYQTLWNLCNNSKAMHLSDFMAQVYANTPKSQISAIGTILQSQKITPILPNSPNDILNFNSSILSWTVYSAFVSANYLDSFTVVFMDLSYNIKHEISVSTNKFVDLTSDINTLMSVLPSEFYWGIKVNQYDSSANTGPYYSVLQRMTGMARYSYITSSDSYELTKITNVSGGYNMPGVYDGKSVTAIGASAFANCTQLSKITIPERVTSIGNKAFYNCRGLKTVNIPSGVKNLGDLAFAYCTGIETINFNATALADFSSSNEIFSYLGQIGNITVNIGTNVTRIPAYLFNNIEKNTTINFNSTVCQSIGDYAFYGCRGLTNFNFGTSNALTSIGERAFSYCERLESINIPSSVTTIEKYAFYNCGSLTSIILPEGLKTIENNVFYGCSSLENINIPSNVTTIGTGAFVGCIGLESITVAIWNTVYKSEGNCIILRSEDTVIQGCKNSVIPEYITRIGEEAFRGCLGLTNITLPYGLRYIDRDAFMGSGLINMVVPGSVEVIGFSAFSDTDIISLTIPFVGERADGAGNPRLWYIFGQDYLRVTSLNHVIITGGSEISEHAFQGFSSIISVTIPSSVTKIDTYAFAECTSLRQIIIPDSVEEIMGAAFYMCTSLSSVVFGENPRLTTIYNSAFSNCYSLTSITIPKSVLYVGQECFNKCINLTTVIFERSISMGSVTEIGGAAFFDCKNLAIVYMPDGDTEIASREILRFDLFALKYVWFATQGLEYTLNSFGTYTVSKGSALISGSITIAPKYRGIDVTHIADYAFYDCKDLYNITIPARITNIGSHAFALCSNLTIYTENTSKPNGWNGSYNSSNRPVIWGCTLSGSGNKSYAESFMKTASSFSNFSVSNDNSAPWRQGYMFGGWAVDQEGTVAEYSMESISECPDNVRLYAIWRINPFKYNLVDYGTGYEVSVKDAITLEGRIIIPSLYNGLPVVKIAASAFYDNFYGNNYARTNLITSIFIPDSITDIGGRAFGDLPNLVDVTMPAGILNIANTVFANCSSLRSITLPNSIITMGLLVFDGCDNLTIYAEAANKPNGWNIGWNVSERPVIWGCTVSSEENYVRSFTKTTNSISNPYALNGISAPYRRGCYFEAWYTNPDFSDNSYSSSDIASAPDGTYYAKWTGAMYSLTFIIMGNPGLVIYKGVEEGDAISPFDMPVLEGCMFLGMFLVIYTDYGEYYWQPYDLETPITCDMEIFVVYLWLQGPINGF